MFYNVAKKEAIKKLKDAEAEYQKIAQEANTSVVSLYQSRKSGAKAIERVQEYVNSIANTPKEFKKDIDEVVLQIKDFNEAVKIEEESGSNNIKGMGLAMGGVFAGGAVAAAGPTVAMAVATTFGVASTGTPIAALSGAVATKAALAWLGGGAISAGGGGMVAGQAFLALAGPVGLSIAGVLAVGGGVFATFKNKSAAKKANNARTEIRSKISELKPKLEKLLQLERKTKELKSALDVTPFNLFPRDYKDFNDSQKKTLAALINNAKAMGQLINERIS